MFLGYDLRFLHTALTKKNREVKKRKKGRKTKLPVRSESPYFLTQVWLPVGDGGVWLWTCCTMMPCFLKLLTPIHKKNVRVKAPTVGVQLVFKQQQQNNKTKLSPAFTKHYDHCETPALDFRKAAWLHWVVKAQLKSVFTAAVCLTRRPA